MIQEDKSYVKKPIKQIYGNAVFPWKSVVSETHQTLRAHPLVLNTFEDLEGPMLSQIRVKFLIVFTIGPVHAHLNIFDF